ncbi:class I SAM-dependent methyltransferase [bacterium]|nr:class I SAM-dependent methyltransferase [bacterium]
MTECAICSSTHLETFRAPEWMFRTGKAFLYAFCRNCFCIQLQEKVTDFSDIYPRQYHSFQRDLEQFYSTPLQKKELNKLKFQFENHDAHLKKHSTLAVLRGFKVGKEMQIADIGCGSGELLYLLKELGFEQTIGFDPYLKSNIRYSNGLEIKKLGIDQIQDSFDLIMLHHSFEHMENPRMVLKRLCHLLKDSQGKLLIRIPLVNHAWNCFREYWYQLDPPRHIHLYSMRGFTLLLKECGLEIERTIFDSTPAQILLSEKNFYRFNRKDLNYYLKRLIKPVRRMLLKRQVARWNREGLGDQAAFLIKKAEV